MRTNKKLDDNLIFLNAGNEWAEGVYIEPDSKWQYGYLEAVKDAVLQCREKKEMPTTNQGNMSTVGVVACNNISFTEVA